MDILKAFVFDNTSHDVNIIHETSDCPLFRDLDLRNIHTSIVDFDENEKVLRTTDSLGGDQTTLFLTEQGVHKLIMRSRNLLQNHSSHGYTMS